MTLSLLNFLMSFSSSSSSSSALTLVFPSLSAHSWTHWQRAGRRQRGRSRLRGGREAAEALTFSSSLIRSSGCGRCRVRHHLGVVRVRGREGLLGAVQQESPAPSTARCYRPVAWRMISGLNLHLVHARCGLQLVACDAVRVLRALNRWAIAANSAALRRMPKLAAAARGNLDGRTCLQAVQADAAVWIVVLRARVDFLQRPVGVGLRERRRDL